MRFDCYVDVLAWVVVLLFDFSGLGLLVSDLRYLSLKFVFLVIDFGFVGLMCL